MSTSQRGSVRRPTAVLALGVLTRPALFAPLGALLPIAGLVAAGSQLLARWGVVAASSLESEHPVRRSAFLTRGHRTRTGALAGLVTALAILIPAVCLTMLLLLTGWSFLFVNVVTSLVAAVVIPVTAATMALLHGDLVERPRDGRQPSFVTRTPPTGIGDFR